MAAERVPVAAGFQVVQVPLPISKSSWVAARTPRVMALGYLR